MRAASAAGRIVGGGEQRPEVSEALPTWSIRLSGARRGGTTNE